MEKKISLEVTRLSPDDEVESAKILFQEGLFDEAKKLLFQILILFPQHKRARKLLDQIQTKEEHKLLEQGNLPPRRKSANENPDQIIEKLNADLGLGPDSDGFDPEKENWHIDAEISTQGRYDLGVAFYEMGCFKDAARELKTAERAVRLERTFLGEFGVSVVALLAECMMELGEVYEVKTYLEPILSEPDLKIEEKVALFYVMGRVEELLTHLPESRGWFQKVVDIDPYYRDAQFRLTQIR